MNNQKFLLKIHLEKPFNGNCRLKSDFEAFTLEEDQPIILPYKDIYQIDFQQKSIEFSQINFVPLIKYPNHKHNLTVQTFDKNDELKKNIYNLKLERRDNFIKIQFIQAFLTKDTEPMGKMSPYVKVQNKNIKNFSWRSKQDKSAHFQPKFNQKINIPFSSLNDRINIFVMDKDIFKDDIIGQIQLRPYELIDSINKIYEKTLYFQDESSGKLRFKILSRPKII